MSINSKLTLLVALKDRAEFTKRLCDYLTLIKYPFHVFFADGSLEDGNEKIINSLKDPGFEYTYKRYPKDLTYLNYYEKVIDALSVIDTPYVVNFCNDDFPVVDTQIEALKFLTQHDDYVACTGNWCPFRISSDSSKAYGEHFFVFDRIVSKWGNLAGFPTSHKQEKALDRIKNFFHHYEVIYRGIYKKDTSLLVFSCLRDWNVLDAYASQFILDLIFLTKGKIHHIDAVDWLKQDGSSQVGDVIGHWVDRLFKNNSMDSWLKAIDFCAKEIAASGESGYQEACSTISDAFIPFIKAFFIPTTGIKRRFREILKKENLTDCIVHKLFRAFPSLMQKINPYLVKDYLPKEYLKDIKQVITKKHD